ncbi:hypothetical protein V8C42DRAFT_101192 [Trichoderma barbatum]
MSNQCVSFNEYEYMCQYPREYGVSRVHGDMQELVRTESPRGMECGGRSTINATRSLWRPCEHHAKHQLKCSDPLTCHISVCFISAA